MIRSKRFLIAALALFMGTAGTAQMMNQMSDPRQLRYDDDEWEFADRSGFTFGLNIGAYFGNKQSAMFYNGEALWDLNDPQARLYSIEERLTLNQPTLQQIQNLVGIDSFTIPNDAAPGNMRYNPGLMFGFRLGYRFNSDNGIFLDANYATLKAADKFTLRTNLLPDPMQGTEDIRLYNIIGEEDRLNINLGYRGAIMINEETNWYIEGGASMLAVRMVDNYLEIEGSTFDLWLAFQAPNFFLGPVSNLTGTGFGYFIGTGVEVFFSETYEINLGLRMNRDQVVMGEFQPWNPRTFEARTRINNWAFFLSFSI